MSQHEPDDFAQLRGTFDQPITPSPQFSSKLKEDLVAEISASSSDRVRLNVVSTPVTEGVTRVQTLTANGWQGALMTAAAILIVLSLSFASLRSINQPGPGDDLNGTTYAPLASATPETETITNLGPFADGFGGADQSFNIGPVASSFIDGPELLYDDSTDFNVTFSQVIGDLMIRTKFSDDFLDGQLEAIDLQSATIRWTLEGQFDNGFATDGVNLFVWLYPPSAQSQLVAVDLETGEIAWELTDPTRFEGGIWTHGPLYANGIVYALSGERSLLAVDAATGGLLWHQTRESTIDRAIFGDTLQDQPATPSFAIDGDQLFIAWEGTTVEALDRISGDTLWTHRPWQINPGKIPYTAMMVDESRIYLSIVESDGSENPEMQVIALERSNAQQVWSVEGANWGVGLVDLGSNILTRSVDGNMQVVSKETGEIISQAESSDYLRSSYKASGAGDSIFVLSNTELRQFNASNLSETRGAWELFERTSTSTPTSDNDIAGPYVQTVPELWQGNVVIATFDGKIWIIQPAANSTPVTTDATPEPASDVNTDVSIGGVAGSDRSNRIGPVSA